MRSPHPPAAGNPPPPPEKGPSALYYWGRGGGSHMNPCPPPPPGGGGLHAVHPEFQVLSFVALPSEVTGELNVSAPGSLAMIPHLLVMRTPMGLDRGAVPHRDPMVIHLNTVGLKLDELQRRGLTLLPDRWQSIAYSGDRPRWLRSLHHLQPEPCWTPRCGAGHEAPLTEDQLQTSDVWTSEVCHWEWL